MIQVDDIVRVPDGRVGVIFDTDARGTATAHLPTSTVYMGQEKFKKIGRVTRWKKR